MEITDAALNSCTFIDTLKARPSFANSFKEPRFGKRLSDSHTFKPETDAYITMIDDQVSIKS
jgi:hypothetical protein